MTNIAFTTLVILIFSFPGYVLRASYYAGTFTRQGLSLNWKDDIPASILFSLPLHLVVLSLFEWLQHIGLIQSMLSFDVIFRVMSGEFGDQFSATIANIYANARYLVGYYVAVLTLAAATGYTLRKIVWNRKWDVHYPWLFRYQNEWLYTLLGRDVPIPDGPEYDGSKVYVRLEALTKIPLEDGGGRARLYRGIVEAFTTEEDGSLRDILLTEVERGKFLKEPAKEREFYWKAVAPGDLMVLKYSELQNINITYLLELPQSSPLERTAERQSSHSA